MKCIFTLLFFLTVAIVTTSGAANESAPGATQAAKDMYARGLLLFENKQFDEASIAFRKANELNFHWKVLYNIAQSEAAAKRFGVALASFEEYLSRGGDDISAQRKEEVLAEIVQLRMMCGYLKIDAPAATDIVIDGKFRGKAPILAPLPLSAGVAHQLRATTKDGVIHNEVVEVSGGQTTNVRIAAKTEADDEIVNKPPPVEIPAVKPDASIAVSPQAETHSVNAAPQGTRRPYLKILGIAAISTGIALTATGVVLGIRAHRDSETLRADCGGTTCDDAYSDDIARLESLDNAGTVLIGSGTAIAVVGAIMTVLHRKRKDSFSRMTTGAAVSSGSSAMTFEWRF